MRSYRVVFLSLFILIMCGCSSSSTLNPLSLLMGNKWELSSLMGDAIAPGKFNASLPNLSFLEGGKLSGYAGCNNFSGGFSLEGTGIQLDPGAMTRMACPGTGEDEFVSALGKVKNFQVSKDKLTLTDGVNELLSFVPKKN